MAKASGAVILQGSGGIYPRFTVGNANAITKGDILFLVDPVTASGANLSPRAVAGIAAMDKEVGDGSTSISVLPSGYIVDMVAGAGGCNIGANLKASGGNYVVTGTSDDFMSGLCFAKALETGSANEYIACRLL